MSISERLKIVRLKLGLSQKDMGERLNVTQAAYNRYEKEAREIPQEMLLKLYQVGIDITWLLTGVINQGYTKEVHNSFEWDNTAVAAAISVKLNVPIALLRAISDGEISPSIELYESIMREKSGVKPYHPANNIDNNTADNARLTAELSRANQTIDNQHALIIRLNKELAAQSDCSRAAV